MSGLVSVTGASFLTSVSQKQGIIYCLCWDLALTISAHVSVDGVGLWIHQRMNCKLSFLALLFLLKQQQAACCGSLEEEPKMCVSGLDVCGRWHFRLRQEEDFICQVLTLTMTATANAHVSSFLIRSCCSGVLAASLSRGGTKSRSFKASYAEWNLPGLSVKKKKKNQIKNVSEAVVHTWLPQSKADFSRKGRFWLLLPGISPLSVSQVSESSLPPCTQIYK